MPKIFRSNFITLSQKGKNDHVFAHNTQTMLHKSEIMSFILPITVNSVEGGINQD